MDGCDSDEQTQTRFNLGQGELEIFYLLGGSDSCRGHIAIGRVSQFCLFVVCAINCYFHLLCHHAATFRNHYSTEEAESLSP